MTAKKQTFKPDVNKIAIAIARRTPAHAVVIPPDIHKPAIDKARARDLADTWNDDVIRMHDSQNFEPKV